MERGLLALRVAVKTGEGAARLFSISNKSCTSAMGRGPILVQHRLFCGQTTRLFQKQQEAAKPAKKDAPVPGIPYNKLTIGVPKEIWKNEKRSVAI